MDPGKQCFMQMPDEAPRMVRIPDGCQSVAMMHRQKFVMAGSLLVTKGGTVFPPKMGEHSWLDHFRV